MLRQIPEVKAMTHLIPQSMTVISGNHRFLEKVDVVDPEFFQVIRLPLVEGSPASVFARPESIVLSQKAARKYFGGAPAMGRIITITGKVCDSGKHHCDTQGWPLVVTGIMRDLPHNTQLQADLLIPNTSAADPMSQDDKKGWLWFDGWGYVQLAPGADPASGRHQAQNHLGPFFRSQEDDQSQYAGQRIGDPDSWHLFAMIICRPTGMAA